MILTVIRTLRSWFGPTIDAIFARNIPFDYRWRLLTFQPLAFISNCIGVIPYIFSRSYKVEYLPIAPGRSIRALVFDKARQDRADKLRPLHLNIHGGAFIGGLPENSAPWCARVAQETGAVVVSTEYRTAPRHTFPAAHDDVDAVLAYLRKNAVAKYGANPDLITVSGDSAGGNLALATAASAPGAVKASVTFYAAINLQLPPWEKPKPANFPQKDPLAVLLPLYDSYPGPVRHREINNPRMSPYLAKLEALPENMLLVIAAIDIVVHEQLTFAERLKNEIARDPKHAGRRVETLYVEKAFHGYLSCKYIASISRILLLMWSFLQCSTGLYSITGA